MKRVEVLDRAGRVMKHTCTFVVAYRGRCGKDLAEGDPDRCEEHKDERCANPRCPLRADTECCRTFLGFVCGAPYCDGCGRHDHLS